MSFKSFSRQAKSFIVVAAMLFVTAAPGFVPSLVSAAQVTQRSIELSSAAVSATGVTYTINFTSAGSAAAFVVDFCSNTPLIGATCTAPTGFSVASATSATGGFTTVSDLAANTVQVTGAVGATTAISVDLDNITNPSTAGPLYARIVTYSDAEDAALYESTDLGDNVVDQGNVAVSITPTIGVSGAVLETMTFCVSGAAIEENCNVDEQSPPTVALGEVVGDARALVPEAVSTGSVYTQISTNAVGGAIVALKSDAVDCGGLKRAGAPTACDILPALTGGITAGQARFGVIAGAATNTGTGANGAFQPVAGSGYNDTTYALNYVAGNATGVTSTYGDPFLDTNDAPANNKNVQLTFGASVSNSTPAGLYSANLNLIATGKF